MSHNRLTPYQLKLPKGPNGRNMCRNKCGVEVKPPRRTFCSEDCVHHYMLRSNVGYLRDVIFKRDKGICAECGFDCHKVRKSLGPKRLDKVLYRAKAKDYIARGFPKDPRRSWWEAHHIVAVCEGGGECDLTNIATLCCCCHKVVTKKLLAERCK